RRGRRHSAVCARRTRRRPLPRHGRGRPVRGAVRQLFDRGAGVLGGAGAGRLDFLRDGSHLPLYGQPHDRNDLLGKLTTSRVATALPDFAVYCEGGRDMSTIRSDTGDGAAEVPSVTQPSAHASRPLLRRVGWSTFFACTALALVLGAGFLWFVW